MRKWNMKSPLFLPLILTLFSSAQAEWNDPITIYRGVSAVDPVTGIAGNGKASVLFIARDDISTDFYRTIFNLNANTILDKKEFELCQSEYSTIAAPHSIALNANGEGIASWIDLNEGSYALFASNYKSNRWLEETVVAEGESCYNTTPFSSIDYIGNRKIFWAPNNNSDEFNIKPLHACSLEHSQTNWGSVKNALFLPDPVRNFQIASSSSGWNSVISQTQSQITGYTLLEEDSSLISTMDNRELYEKNPIATACNKIGSALFIWSIDNCIFLKLSDSVNIANCTIEGPSISKISATLDSNNKSMSIFSQVDPETNSAKLFSQIYTGEEWTFPIQLDSHFEDFLQIEQKCDEIGNRYLIWSKRDESGIQSIYANRYDMTTNSWESAPSRLSIEGIDAINPSLSVNEQGDAFVAWSTHSEIQGRFHLNSKSNRCHSIKKYTGRANHLKKKQRRYTLHMRWKADPTPNTLACYTIYENGLPIATINSANQKKFHLKLRTNHHFHKELLRKKYIRRLEKRYSIAALHENGTVEEKKEISIDR